MRPATFRKAVVRSHVLFALTAHGEVLCERHSNFDPSTSSRKPAAWNDDYCTRQQGGDMSQCHWRVGGRNDLNWAVATTLEGHSDAVCAVAFSPDMSRIVSASADGTAIIWQETNHEEEFPGGGSWSPAGILGEYSHDVVRDVRWSPDGTRLLTGNVDGKARVWRASTNAAVNGTSTNVTAQQGPPLTDWEVIAMLIQPDTVLAVDWTFNESSTGRVLTGRRDRTACRQLLPEASTVISETSLDGAAKFIGPAYFSLKTCVTEDTADDRARGDTYLVSSYDRSGSIWEANCEAPLRWGLVATMEASTHVVSAVRWSPNGNRIMTGDVDGIVRIWQLAERDFHGSGRLVWSVITWHQCHNESVLLVAWSPDADRIVTGDRNEVFIWRPFEQSGWLREAMLNPTLGADDPPPRLNSASHAPKYLARLDTLTPAFNMRWISPWSHSTVAVWSPDGSRVLTGSRDGSVRIWLESMNASNSSAWSIEVTLQGHKAEIVSLDWSPDSLSVLSGDKTGLVRLWKAAGAL